MSPTPAPRILLCLPCSLDGEELPRLLETRGFPPAELASKHPFLETQSPIVLLTDAANRHLPELCDRAADRNDATILALGQEEALPRLDPRRDESIFACVDPVKERGLLRVLRRAMQHVSRSRDTSDSRLMEEFPLARRVSRSIAHDVKNHLSSIRGLGELLRLKINAIAGLNRFAETIMDEADHLGRLADGLHDFAVAPVDSLSSQSLSELLHAVVQRESETRRLEVQDPTGGGVPLSPIVGTALAHLLETLFEFPGGEEPRHLTLSREEAGFLLRFQARGFEDEKALARLAQLRKWLVGHRSHSAQYPWISIAIKILSEWGVEFHLDSPPGIDLILHLPGRFDPGATSCASSS